MNEIIEKWCPGDVIKVPFGYEFNPHCVGCQMRNPKDRLRLEFIKPEYKDGFCPNKVIGTKS